MTSSDLFQNTFILRATVASFADSIETVTALIKTTVKKSETMY